ncbi:MAG: WecB/TagA/CpsF family glycosyltransferase [Synechococcales bacterium]|nr:WecB/TagA/CpsF family glycosyltransferase [Synechococcales bacterium]
MLSFGDQLQKIWNQDSWQADLPLQRVPAESQGLPNLCVYLLGRRITFMTDAAIIQAIQSACEQNRRITVANYNVHAFNLSMQQPWFYNFLQGSEIVHCDGSGILKALKILGLNLPLPYRVSYTVLMPELLQHCHEQQLSVFLLGAKPEILTTALQNLRSQYPQAKFAGHHGYFKSNDEQTNRQIVHQINQCRPNVLIVGMGMPRQEQWVQQYRDQLQVNAILTGGAVIDRFAGVVSDCPRWLSRWGLEWCYRLCREPKRLAARYLLGNPAFVLQVILAKFLSFSGANGKNCWSRTVSQSELLTQAACLTQQSAPVKKRIGEYLVELGLVSSAAMEAALAEQRATGVRLGTILASRELVSQETIDLLVAKLLLLNQYAQQVDNHQVIGTTIDFLAEKLISLE